MNPETFYALAEPHRLQIVQLLRGKPRSVGELADSMHIRQPQASKHLKILATSGFVTVHPYANQRIYKLSPTKFKEIDNWLEGYRKLWNNRLNRLDNLLENIQRKDYHGHTK